MNKEKVLVISAHPDDEVLGCGGTLLRHKNIGNDIYWIIVTGMYKSIEYSNERISSRELEINNVVKELNIKEVFQLNYPTTSLTPVNLQTLIPKISEIFKKVKPAIIFCPNRSDAHSDHRIVFEATMASTKSFRHPYIREVLMYECLSETEFAPALSENSFVPNCFVDVSNVIEEKIQLMNIYKNELGEHPFPRSERNIRALATFRGAIAGVEYAEAFQLIKSIRIEDI